MSEKWPPSGYHEPQEYQVNKLVIVLLGLAAALVLGVYAFPKIDAEIGALIKTIISIIVDIGITNSVVVLLGVFLGIFVWIFALLAITIPVHEAVHYLAGKYLGLNPVYRWDDSWGSLKNPSVVAVAEGIPIPKNILMILLPFVALTVLSAVIIELTDSIIAASFALILLVNGSSSSQDLYHAGRLWSLPKGTLFKNKIENGSVTTEFAIPEQYHEWSEADPPWVRALKVIYESTTPMSPRDPGAAGSIPDDSPLRTQTGLNHQQLREALDYLLLADLVEVRGGNQFSLTKDGFDVAHEREMAEERNSINRALVLFTFVLVLVSLISVIDITWVSLVGGFAILVFLAVLVVSIEM